MRAGSQNGVNPLRVLHVVGGRLSGGAARGTRILSEALREVGIYSRILCADPSVGGDQNDVISVASKPWTRALHAFRSKRERIPSFLNRSTDAGLFSPGVAGINLLRHPAYHDADIIHLHWINGGLLSIEGLAGIDKPMVWTMRDMWPFTGGCHYALNCSRFTEHCGQCPQLRSSNKNDVSAEVLKRKKALYPADTTYVGISSWISEVSASSALLRDRDIRTVSNCIDTSVFKRVPSKEARAKLGLSPDAKIILHGALSLDDPYKGHMHLKEAIERLPRSEFTFCSFGASNTETGADVDFGLIHDDEKLRDIYAASDVLVFPSIQEAFGKVPAEAMACGTPVVAFGATGLSDIVTDRVNGYAAKPFDAADLAAGIVWCTENDARLKELSDNAEKDAHTRFAPSKAAQSYIDIYHQKVT